MKKLFLAVFLAVFALAATAHAADRVYWANYGNSSIASANPDGGSGADLNTGATTMHSPTGTAIDVATSRIYWADNGTQTIKFANLDGTDGGGTLNTTGATVDEARGMVLDSTAGKLYWANQALNKISYANLNGSGGGDLDTTGATVVSPDGVAIDKTTGRIYWANDDSILHPISYANVDGSGGGADLDTTGATVSTAIGPSLDTGSGKIYWGNKANDTISFAKLDGSGGGGQLTTTGATIDGPWGTAIDSEVGKIYVANFDGAKISVVGEGGGGGDVDTTGATVTTPMAPSLLKKPFGTGAPSISGTPQYGQQLTCTGGTWAQDDLGAHLYRAPSGSNAYEWLRDGTPIGGATTDTYQVTGADIGHELRCGVTASNFAGPTTQTSQAVQASRRVAERVFWAGHNASVVSFADLTGGNGADLDTTGATVDAPEGVAIDSAAGRIYWTNQGGSTPISFANLGGEGAGGALNTTGATASSPEGLAIDPTAGRLYWANPNDNSISYANLDGSGGADLDTTGATVDQPTGVAVDPASGRIYWANRNDNTHPISYTNLDGTGAGGDLDTSGATASSPWGLAIDQAGGKLYWANEGNDTISFANLDGSGGGAELDATGATVHFPTGVALDPAAGRAWWSNFGGANHISFADIAGGNGGNLDTTGATNTSIGFLALLEKPANVAAPNVSGTPSAGHNLSCSNGGWAPDLLGAFLYRAPQDYSYEWQRDNVAISGQTASTYAVQSGDTGHVIKCRVTAQNGGGSADSTSAGKTILAAPHNTAAPSISGTPVAGHTLTCAKGTWTGSAPITYAYRWLRNNVAIIGATSSTYVVKSADIGKQLKCRVTASNGGGSTMALSAAKLIKTPPKNTVAPKITGIPKVGKTLTCNKGTWTGTAPITYKYQWLRNGSPIAGATAATYVAKAADQNKFLSCKVTATNAAGTATKTSAAVKIT
jgi:DNA-binding beta-propeller fold protein YncE